MSHRRAFTVYPPGYVPYGRQSWIPVDLCGHWVNRPVPTGTDIGFAGCEFRGMRGLEAWEALAERPCGRDPPHFSTQRRMIDRAGRLSSNHFKIPLMDNLVKRAIRHGAVDSPVPLTNATPTTVCHEGMERRCNPRSAMLHER